MRWKRLRRRRQTSGNGVREDSDGLLPATEDSPGQNLKDGRSPPPGSFSDTDVSNAKRLLRDLESGPRNSNLRGESLAEEVNMPKSKFIRIKCQDCGGEEAGQMIFSHPSTTVTCNVCGATLIKPSGGKGKIRGEILGVSE